MVSRLVSFVKDVDQSLERTFKIESVMVVNQAILLVIGLRNDGADVS